MPVTPDAAPHLRAAGHDAIHAVDRRIIAGCRLAATALGCTVLEEDAYETLVVVGFLVVAAVWEWFRLYYPRPQPVLVTAVAFAGCVGALYKLRRARKRIKPFGSPATGSVPWPSCSTECARRA